MVKEFNETRDYKELVSWYHARDLVAPGLDMLPTYGLIIKGIAAGFIIVTDCNLGYLEFYISNPHTDKKERDLALDLITRGLIEHGESVGISNFKCDTQSPAVMKRASRFGFRDIGLFSNYFLSIKE